MGSIRRFRGDTAPDQFAIKRSGVAVDITGCSFELTVNSVKDPTDTSTQLFSVPGVIISAVDGQVDFSPNATQADQLPGRYYYDVQMTDVASKIRTVEKGAYRFVQDISKT